MQIKHLKLKIITPLFNQGTRDDVGLKLASFKGLLRFWWRALEAENNLISLKLKEQSIFGGVTGEALASPLRLKMISEEDLVRKEYNESNITKHAKYLTLGLFEMGKDGYDRTCVESGTYNIQIQYPDKYQEDISKALLAFHYFGNLGAKARNGFGSLYLKNFRDFTTDENNTPEKFFKWINKKSELPHYSAFSVKTKLFVNNEVFSSADQALSKMSAIYMSIRSTQDNVNSIESQHSYDIRKYLAFPIGPRVPEKGVFKSDKGRYSKPYFFKIYKADDTGYRLMVLNLIHKYAHGLEFTDDADKMALSNKNLQTEFESACNKFNSYLIKHSFMEVK